MKKRIAVCISGQLRTFEDIWLDNNKILNDSQNVEIDYFCYFWKKNGNTWRTLDGNNRYINNLFLDPFIYYPSKNEEIVKKSSIEKIISAKKISIALDNEEKLLNKDNVLELVENYPGNKKMAFASFCLWKSVYECNNLRNLYEKENNIKYDAVVRIRPDWKLKKNPIQKYLSNNNDLLFFDSSAQKGINKGYQKVTDVCFISKPLIMDLIANLYHNLIVEIESNGWKKFEFASDDHLNRLIGESALYWFIESENIKINDYVEERYGYIYRSAYKGVYEKKIFSIKLLIKQMLEMPDKFIKSL